MPPVQPAGWRRGEGVRSGGVGPPRPLRRPPGGDSGAGVTQLERTLPPDDRPRPPRAQRKLGDSGLGLEDFGEVPDDAVRALDDARGQTHAFAVDPDAAEAETLRRGHVPLEVVA